MASSHSILWVRTDSIGDNILASGMLELVYKQLSEDGSPPMITVLCKKHLSQLYETSPYVSRIVPFEYDRIGHDESYRNSLLAELQQLRFSLAVNSVFSRDVVSDLLTLGSGALRTLAHEGDDVNIDPVYRLKHNKLYTALIPSQRGLKSELTRHTDLLSALGVHRAEALTPRVWLTQNDEEFAERFFREKSLKVGEPVVIYVGSQMVINGQNYKDYPELGLALKQTSLGKKGTSLIAVGSAQERGVNEYALRCYGGIGHNISGSTTLRQTAAILKRCAYAIGVDSAPTHIASAVGVPSLTILGGAHYGRFLPYTPLTSVVVLPLDCFGCNWRCRFHNALCVKGVRVDAVAAAIDAFISHTDRCESLVFTQQSVAWEGSPQIGQLAHGIEPCRIRVVALS